MVAKNDEVIQLDLLKKQFTSLKNEIAKVIVGQDQDRKSVV